MTASANSRLFTVPNLYIAIQVFNRVGRPELVAQCGGYCREAGVIGPPFYEGFHETSMREARNALGDDAFERYVAAGAATTTDDFYETIVGVVTELLAGMPTD